MPSECNNFEELLWTDEFKKVLSRSPFSYDVNVVESPENIVSKAGSISHVCENLFPRDNLGINEQSLTEFDVLFCSSSNGGNTQGKATEDQLLHVINQLTYSVSIVYIRMLNFVF